MTQHDDLQAIANILRRDSMISIEYQLLPEYWWEPTFQAPAWGRTFENNIVHNKDN